MKRKLVDEQGRLFGRISLIDIFVVIVVLVLACAVYMRFFTHSETSSIKADDTFEFQVCLQGVRKMTADALCVGDTVYSNNVYVGVITDIQTMDSQKETQLLDGTYVLGQVENRYDVIVTIDSKGLISNGRYYASHSLELGVNEKININTKYCSTSGVVWSIEND